MIEVSNRFNAKLNTSNREYSYYLPSFLLSPMSENYLGKKGTGLKPEEETGPKDEDITGVKVVNGITITKRYTNEGDKHDDETKHLGRDISHLTQERIEQLYSYRLSGEQKE